MAKYLYGYHEERGFADLYVTDRNGKTVWEAHYPSFYESNGEMLEETTIFEDGFMKNAEDTEGLEFYLKSISVINKDDKLVEIDDDDDDDEDDDDEYAAGGTIESKIKKRLKNAFELPIQVAVYVPSTRDKDIIIPKREMEARVEEVQRFLANAFGGFSAVKVEGGFESSDKGLIQEDAVRVVAFASKENENGVPFEKSFESLMNQVKNWCSKWSQQSIGVEFENDLFYVDTETKFANGGFTQYGEPMGFEEESDIVYEIHHKPNYNSKNPYLIWDKIDGVYIAEFPNRQRALHFIDYKSIGYMADGGDIAEGNLQMLRSNAKAIKHHAEELEGELNDDTQVEAWVVAKGERAATDLSDITHYLDGKKFSLGGMTAGRWYRDKSGEEFKFIGKIDSGENKGRFLFSDGKQSVYKDLEDFEGGRPKETKLFGFFEDGGEIKFGEDLGGGFSIGNDVYITDSKSLFQGKTGFVSGSVGRDLLVTIMDNGNERSVIVSKKGVEKLDAPEYAKGGSIKSLEKRVAEVNELIKRGNELGIEVVDEGNTWQAPMKYKPLKYTNGVLYVSYEQLDLYKYNREYVQDWEKKSYKIGKYESGYGYRGEAGAAQREALTEIARMYRKPLKSYDTYGYFEDGGEVNKVNPEEIKVKIEQILDKVVPSFYKGVSIHKNIFDSGNNIRIFIAASDYKINDVRGQLPQVVSLSLDLSDMDLHPQVYGGNGGQRVERKPNMSDPNEKYLAMKGVKVPFRTPQPNEKAVLDAIRRFAENYKKTLAENREVLLYQDVVDYDKLLAGSQYADGGMMADGGTVSDSEILKLKEQVLDLYGNDEMFDEYSIPKNFTSKEINQAIRMYLDWVDHNPNNWGGGDSNDVEIVGDIILYNRGEAFYNLTHEREVKEVLKTVKRSSYADGGISKDSKWYEANYKVQGLDSNVHFAAKSDREAIKLATNKLKRPNAELLNIYLVEGDKYTIIYGDSWESIRDTSKMAKGGEVEKRVNTLYSRYDFINDDFNWRLKLLEMLQNPSYEAYEIYQSLNNSQKEEVLQELYEMDNDMGSDGDGDIETSKENLEILLDDSKNAKPKLEKGGMVKSISQAKKIITDANTHMGSDDYKILKSKKQGFSWFVPDLETYKEKDIKQENGEHFTDSSLISFANEINPYRDEYAKGGTFAAGVKAIEKRLVGTKVNPKYQKDYGKTYDKAEAHEAASKIKGKMRAMELANKYKKKKLADGGGVGRTVMIPTYVVKEINDSVKMGYDTLVDGMIGRKRKGVMLINDKYEVRGTYDIGLKDAIQNIIDKIKSSTFKVDAVDLKADGGMMAKGGLIASSPTKEGIEKLIGDYYYSKNISLKKLDDKDEYEVSNSKGKINGVKVIVKKGRYQFVESDKMADGGLIAQKPEYVKLQELENKINYSQSRARDYVKWREGIGANYEDKWNKMMKRLRGWNAYTNWNEKNTKPEWKQYCKERGLVENYDFGDVLA